VSALLLLASTPTRQVLWDVPSALAVFMYASMGVALAVFAYGAWRRLRIWRLGRRAVVWDRPGARLRRMLAAIGHSTLFRKPLPGVMHALIFSGWWILFAATVMVFLDSDLGLTGVYHGSFYLYFESLTVDLLGIVFLLGLLVAGWRRYVVRPRTLEKRDPADALLLGSLLLIALTGFGLEGIRLAATHDHWAGWSPGGWVVARALGGLGSAGLRSAYPWLWTLHVLMWHTLLASIPFTKAIHAFTSPLNVFFANPGPPRSVPAPTDFEAEPVRLGIRTARDMTWKQLFDLDACTECGRCEAVCPATAAGTPLSPKRVILDLRDAIHARGAEAEPLSDVVGYDALWACTTCRACEEACPVGIEHVPTIVGLRQNLAMEQVKMPAGVADTVANLEAREHPFRGATAERTDWLKGIEVAQLDSVENADGLELVYWIGCSAAFDERAQQIARAVVRVLQHAGVRFAVVASQERCNGDVARRTGNEFHYDLLANANVETLNGAGVTKILTHCPHCLQQLRYEYAPFGGRYEAVHHSELVSELIEEGRIRLQPGERERVTYHDPCYLGRYNREFDAPRRVLDALQVERVEMPRSRAGSFCCGAGGGHAFFEQETGDDKIEAIRTREAAATGATTVVTGCPFCLTMLTSGARSLAAGEPPLQTRDFVELVADALAD
jgi:Fe-S oxidoreductase/nitrate reductase gamma subunit